MSQIVSSRAPARACPGAPHPPSAQWHCADGHCIERRPGLLVLWWTRGMLVSHTDVMRAFTGMRELSDGQVLPLVVHLQELAGYVAEAREAVRDWALSARVAIVGSSPVDRVIAAFLETGFIETRYFECPVTAEAWALKA